MKIYIAGPMRGLPEWNFPAFDEARIRLCSMGHQVFCPAQLFRAMPYGMETVDRAHLLHVIQSDLACLYAVDAIALLPGWENSVGVTVELAMAQFLGLGVLDARTGEPMQVVYTPWKTAHRVAPNPASFGPVYPGVGHSY